MTTNVSNALRKAVHFATERFPDDVMCFDNRNSVGDEMETIYEADGITIDYCFDWDYIEVFGLSPKEFDVFYSLVDNT